MTILLNPFNDFQANLPVRRNQNLLSEMPSVRVLYATHAYQLARPTSANV